MSTFLIVVGTLMFGGALGMAVAALIRGGRSKRDRDDVDAP